jgi:leader peptidase (prepilin peptidase)/N-methyltransferase
VGLATFATLIAAGDALTRRIPNRLNAAAAASLPPLLGVALTAGYGSAVRAVAGGAAAFAVYAVLWLVAPKALGAGDVKLAPYLGAVTAFVDWACWSRALVLGMVLQGVLVAAGLLTGRLDRRSHVAHGPAMCLGAVLAILGALSRW